MINRDSWARQRRQGSHAVRAKSDPYRCDHIRWPLCLQNFPLLPLENLTSPILHWILRYRLEQGEDSKQEVGRVPINEWRLFEVLPEGQTCFCFYVSRKTETFLFFYFAFMASWVIFSLDYILWRNDVCWCLNLYMSRGRVLELEFYTYPYKPRFRFS